MLKFQGNPRRRDVTTAQAKQFFFLPQAKENILLPKDGYSIRFIFDYKSNNLLKFPLQEISADQNSYTHFLCHLFSVTSSPSAQSIGKTTS
jgi:hypothetical protein